LKRGGGGSNLLRGEVRNSRQRKPSNRREGGTIRQKLPEWGEEVGVKRKREKKQEARVRGWCAQKGGGLYVWLREGVCLLQEKGKKKVGGKLQPNGRNERLSKSWRIPWTVLSGEMTAMVY